MKTVSLFSVAGRQVTATEAMEKFAASYWQEPRKLGTIHPAEFHESSYVFQMVDGNAWYQADPTGGGWLISLVIPGDEPQNRTPL